ncbi:hypothetical protein AVEN_65244-1 [Araneus ventricosus]|uniref:Uncharacterized protein n=1 Tax=Araneus ventricosus TaxID=182803 RepID=A0A4Y2AFP2_ARAVE|nr:hypothetical protein AVEN_65244-1 [Araneus ventricosus]
MIPYLSWKPLYGLHTIPAEGRLATDVRFSVPQSTADLLMSRVSNLEPSGPKSNILPLGNADLTKIVAVTEEISVCSLVHRDKVRYPRAPKRSDTIAREPPSRPSIRAWYTSFMETG